MTTDTRFDGTAFGYGYDGDGRLATVTRNALPESSYGYDAFQRRVLKTAGGLARHFVYDPDGHLLAEATGAGATTTEYVWLGDTPLTLVADVDTASPRLYWFHTDQLGTPQKLTDQAGNLAWDAVLEPFGELASLTVNLVAQPLRLPGQYADLATGLHQNWWRDYDPGLGRYLQPDPLGIAAGSNLYGYADGNPVSFVDPDGRNPLLWMLGGAVLAGGLDLALQLDANDSNLDCVDWWEVGGSGLLGAVGGVAGWTVKTGRIAWKGGELVAGRNWRFNPAGNWRNARSWQDRLPHYHRRSLGAEGKAPSGQGIGRHRPWDSRPTDKSFWDRF